MSGCIACKKEFNETFCPCPKKSCVNHGVCCDCVVKHKETDSLPYCLFSDNGGDKSVANYYKKLKERFED